MSMNKVHFEGLTEINVPFGLLDEDTKDRLRTHYNMGGAVERFFYSWVSLDNPVWDDGATYRAAPVAFKYDETIWKYFADWVRFIAMDADGAWIACNETPKIDIERGSWCDIDAVAYYESLYSFNLPEHPNWQESLIERPEEYK